MYKVCEDVIFRLRVCTISAIRLAGTDMKIAVHLAERSEPCQAWVEICIEVKVKQEECDPPVASSSRKLRADRRKVSPYLNIRFSPE